MKRKTTDLIVVHCSATRPDQDIGADEIRQWHTDPKPKGRGWKDIGYHYVIRRCGSLDCGRPLEDQGAHANMKGHGGKSYNPTSVGVCLVGGLDEHGKPTHNFTRFQMNTLRALVYTLLIHYPRAEVVGHRDLSPDHNHDGIVDRKDWVKVCPCFEVKTWWAQAKKTEDAKR